MMMSKVAPAMPTTMAAMATLTSASFGSAMPRNATATITSTPTSQSQLRRCPKRPISGSRTLSTTGAQRNLKLYARKVRAKAVTALLVMPCCASRVVSVAPIIEKAKPDEMPRKSAASGAGSRYWPIPLEGPVIVDGERRVVGEPLPFVDGLAHGGGCYARRRHLVVDAPPHILRPRLAAIRPPGVMAGVRVELAEHVDEADLVEHMREPGSLFGREARVLLIGAPVRKVDLLVGDVPVAAQDDFGFAFAQALQVRSKVLEESQLGCLPVRTRRAGGHVKRYHPQLAEARLDITALGVEFTHPEAAQDLVGRLAAVERDAAIALLLRKRMARLESLESMQLRVEIGLLALHLLQAHDVRALRLEPAKKALARRRADPVSVERDYPDGKVEAPPCAADHLAGSCRNFSTSSTCADGR